MYNRRKGLTVDEALQIFFDQDTDESDFSESEIDDDDDNDDNDGEEADTNLVDPHFAEDDYEPDDNFINYEWSSSVDNSAIVIEKFSSSSGPVHDLEPGASALSYLRLLISDDLCDNIIINTNKYADFCQNKRQKKDENWIPISNIREIWCFFGILLVMSIVRMPKLSDYWSTNSILGNQMVKKLMSRTRFMKIKHYFHISDREAEPNKNDESFRYSQKLEPMFNDVKRKFQTHFNPYKHLSVDEAMIKYKGRLGIVQYMPLKPAKRGLKMWMLCTSNEGYVYNFDIYGGKNDNIPRSSKGLGYDVVMHLITPLKNRGHELFFDRFFTSVQLVHDLLKLGIFSCGTLMKNRKNLPIEIKNLKLTQPHENKVFQCKTIPNMLCSAWLDKKIIFMLSVNAKNETTTVKRRNKSLTTSVNCPFSFNLYNKYMGGVDLADQRRKYYSVSRKSNKWWNYVFSFLFDTAVNNAYIIQKTTNFPSPKKMKSLYDFKLEIIENIEAQFLERKRTHPPFSPTSFHNHKRVKIEGRKRTCVRCRELKIKTTSNNNIQSTWECEICKMCLCKTCFNCESGSAINPNS